MSGKLMYLDKYGELLPKTKRFCELYFKGEGSVSQCMAKADFSPYQSRVYSPDILTYPEVKAYLDSLDEKIAKEVVASKEDVLTFWTELMGNQFEKTSDRLNASKLLAQYLRMMDTGDKGEDKPIIVFDIKPEVESSSASGKKSAGKLPPAEPIDTSFSDDYGQIQEVQP